MKLQQKFASLTLALVACAGLGVAAAPAAGADPLGFDGPYEQVGISVTHYDTKSACAVGTTGVELGYQARGLITERRAYCDQLGTGGGYTSSIAAYRYLP